MKLFCTAEKNKQFHDPRNEPTNLAKPEKKKKKSGLLFPNGLNWYYDEKMLFSFSLDSDSMFGKIAPCQLLRLNLKQKSDFLSYDFSFKLSAITRFCSSRVALRELDRERK